MTCYDKRGVPIWEGDLLKSFHFRGRPYGRNYWLYHAVIDASGKYAGTLEMVPIRELITGKKDGGRCWLTQAMADNAEVIEGAGPNLSTGDDFNDRPKQRRKVRELSEEETH